LPMERDGRPVHLVGLVMQPIFEITASGTHGAPCPGPYRRSILRNIHLRTGDHAWIDGLDGDEVHWLSEQRLGRPWRPRALPGNSPDFINEPDPDATFGQPEADLLLELKNQVNTLADYVSLLMSKSDGHPDDIPDAAADETVFEEICYLAAQPSGIAYPGTENDGAIPLMLLDHMRGANHLSFTVASGLKEDSDFAYTGTTGTVTVYAILRPLDELRIPSPHRMRGYDETKRDFVYRSAGRVMTFGIRDTRDANGVMDYPNHLLYSGITLTCDDQVYASDFVGYELYSQHMWKRRLGQNHDGELVGYGYAPFLPIAQALPGEKRSRMMSGKFRVQINERRDSKANLRNDSRLLVHETGRNTNTYHQAMHRVLGVDASRAGLETRLAKPKGTKKHPMADVLDHATYFPGMAGMGLKVPSAKARRKA
jgi:hypothetical protein